MIRAMSNVVIYYRVSTAKQGASGLGLDAQRSVVERYLATRPGTEVLAEHTEIESGAKSDRIELDRALRRCRLTGATLVVAKLDRLARDAEFILRLQKASDTRFVIAEMPEANSLTIGLLALVAQHERELISQRTRAAMAVAKERGTVFGNPNLAAVANTDTAAAVQARVDRAAARNSELASTMDELEGWYGRAMNNAAMARAMNEAGYRTARGAQFTATTVRRIRLLDKG